MYTELVKQRISRIYNDKFSKFKRLSPFVTTGLLLSVLLFRADVIDAAIDTTSLKGKQGMGTEENHFITITNTHEDPVVIVIIIDGIQYSDLAGAATPFKSYGNVSPYSYLKDKNDTDFSSSTNSTREDNTDEKSHDWPLSSNDIMKLFYSTQNYMRNLKQEYNTVNRIKKFAVPKTVPNISGDLNNETKMSKPPASVSIVKRSLKDLSNTSNAEEKSRFPSTWRDHQQVPISDNIVKEGRGLRPGDSEDQPSRLILKLKPGGKKEKRFLKALEEFQIGEEKRKRNKKKTSTAMKRQYVNFDKDKKQEKQLKDEIVNIFGLTAQRANVEYAIGLRYLPSMCTVMIDFPLMVSPQAFMAPMTHQKLEEEVEFIEADVLVHASDLPFVNDNQYAAQWSLQSNSYGSSIDAVKGWLMDKDHQTSSRTNKEPNIIAVIDTGIDYNHPDLKNRMWVNEAELNGSPDVDDDDNGFVDDIYGYNFALDSGDPIDLDGHGTHCAGSIVAEPNNKIGITGVDWSSRIMALKFLRSSQMGYLSDAIRAIDYAISNKATILNNSWGGATKKSMALESIVDACLANNLLLVCAAGNANNNNDIRPDYPSSFTHPNLISVGSNDKRGRLSSFSSYGPTSVDVVAPGEDILSTTPKGGYEYKDGTSMAAPHVAGIAGVVLRNYPRLRSTEIRHVIMESSKYLSSVTDVKVQKGLASLPQALVAAKEYSDALEWVQYDSSKLNKFLQPGATLSLPVILRSNSLHDFRCKLNITLVSKGRALEANSVAVEIDTVQGEKHTSITLPSSISREPLKVPNSLSSLVGIPNVFTRPQRLGMEVPLISDGDMFVEVGQIEGPDSTEFYAIPSLPWNLSIQSSSLWVGCLPRSSDKVTLEAQLPMRFSVISNGSVLMQKAHILKLSCSPMPVFIQPSVIRLKANVGSETPGPSISMALSTDNQPVNHTIKYMASFQLTSSDLEETGNSARLLNVRGIGLTTNDRKNQLDEILPRIQSPSDTMTTFNNNINRLLQNKVDIENYYTMEKGKIINENSETKNDGYWYKITSRTKCSTHIKCIEGERLNELKTKEDPPQAVKVKESGWSFFGTPFDTIYVSANGYISIRPSHATGSYPKMPSKQLPNGVIAPFWNDLVFFDSNGSVFVSQKIKDTIIVEWRNITARSSQNRRATFELIMNKETNTIRFLYKRLNLDDFSLSKGLVGLETPNGEHSISFRTAVGKPETRDVYTYVGTVKSVQTPDFIGPISNLLSAVFSALPITDEDNIATLEKAIKNDIFTWIDNKYQTDKTTPQLGDLTRTDRQEQLRWTIDLKNKSIFSNAGSFARIRGSVSIKVQDYVDGKYGREAEGIIPIDVELEASDDTPNGDERGYFPNEPEDKCEINKIVNNSEDEWRSDKRTDDYSLKEFYRIAGYAIARQQPGQAITKTNPVECAKICQEVGHNCKSFNYDIIRSACFILNQTRHTASRYFIRAGTRLVDYYEKRS